MPIIATIVGARPQFIKCSLLSHQLRRIGIAERLVHTGQHYDSQLSACFFQELGIPQPDINLGVGSDTHGRQTGRMMIALAEELEANRPDLALVFGDTNSTLAAALTAVKMGIPLAHVEAGVRGFNRALPEEHNRKVADHLADLLLCHHERAADLLRAEKVTGRIHVVGDLMRQTVAHFLPLALERSSCPGRFGLAECKYAVLTIHRPANADSPEVLVEIFDAAERLGMPVVFPCHPRTRKHCPTVSTPRGSAIQLIEPLGYLDMLALLARARLVLTDSGGLQKETLFVGTPCVTLRGETEWTETTEVGMNLLTGERPAAERIVECARQQLERWPKSPGAPAVQENLIRERFGPVDVAERIARILADAL